MTERRRDPAISFSAHESLRPSREQGLKIRTLFFPRDHADIDVLEADVFQKLVQLHFAETEPVISVEFARSLELYADQDRKSTRLNSSHVAISYAVFCLKKKKQS